MTPSNLEGVDSGLSARQDRAHPTAPDGRVSLMLTLYYSPGACSMASHIGAEERGAPYETKQILLAKGDLKTPDYLTINLLGTAPAPKLVVCSVVYETTAHMISS